METGIEDGFSIVEESDESEMHRTLARQWEASMWLYELIAAEYGGELAMDFADTPNELRLMRRRRALGSNQCVNKEVFALALQDGVWLCQLAAILWPRSIESISIPPDGEEEAKFSALENIQMFLIACEVQEIEPRFAPNDLLEQNNISLVVDTIHAIAMWAKIRKRGIEMKPCGVGFTNEQLGLEIES